MMQNVSHLPFVSTYIPETGMRYMFGVSDSAIKITDLVVGKDLEPDEEGLYTLIIYGQEYKVSMQWLSCFTYKPLFNAKSFAKRWSVGLKDPDVRFCHPDNLFWIGEEGGTECPERSGFYVIPGYSRHAINKEGAPYSRTTKRLQEVRKSNPKQNNSYFNTNFKNDAYAQCTVGVHRALAAAIFQIKTNPEKITVNHKNGDKTDNRLENLELVSYRDNNLHAKDTGLNNTRKAVVVRDYKEMTETTYNSVSDAALATGMSSAMMSAHVRSGTHAAVRGRYKARFLSDVSENSWGDTVTGFKKIESDNLRVECIAKNMYTGDIVIAPSQYEMADLLGIPAKDVFKCLTRSCMVPVNGYLIVHIDNKDLLDVKYTPEEIKYLESGSLYSSAKPVKVERRKIGDEEGTTLESNVYETVTEAYDKYKNDLTISLGMFKAIIAEKPKNNLEDNGYEYTTWRLWC